MELKLYTYESDRKTVAKTYTAESIDISYGTARNVMKVLRPEELDMNDKKKLGMALLGAWEQVEPLLMDLFPGVSSEELDTVKMSNVIEVLRESFVYLTSTLSGTIGSNSKN